MKKDVTRLYIANKWRTKPTFLKLKENGKITVNEQNAVVRVGLVFWKPLFKKLTTDDVKYLFCVTPDEEVTIKGSFLKLEDKEIDSFMFVEFVFSGEIITHKTIN